MYKVTMVNFRIVIHYWPNEKKNDEVMNKAKLIHLKVHGTLNDTKMIHGVFQGGSR